MLERIPGILITAAIAWYACGVLHWLGVLLTMLPDTLR